MPTNIRSSARLFIAAFLLSAAIGLPALYAETVEVKDPADAILKEIGVDEHPGAYIPLDIPLTDQDGKGVMLRDYFGGRPVILSLNYYECPMLCPITFANLSRTTQDMKGLALGQDYKIVTVSFNPKETLAMARDKSAQTYTMLPGVKNPAYAWPFLFGRPDDIKRITDAVGFRFKEVSPGNFAHPSVLVILSPDGKITRYLYGIKQEPLDLRLALIEAADGKIGASSALNGVLLYCFHYDPVGKRYALAATRVVMTGGALTLVAVTALLASLWRGEKARGLAPPGKGRG